MGLFEDAVLSAKNAVNVAGKKTGDLVEISKLKLAAAELESKIRGAYEALGRSVYTAAKEEADATAVIKEKSEQIDSLTADLTALQEKIAALRAEKKCSACGTINPQDADYCKKCGAKL